jgi:uncharacterized protein
MHINLIDLAIVLLMVFIAGLMDSIAGGGGLISLPAYLVAGLPPHIALGTNKFSSCWGTLFATKRYFHNNMIEFRTALTVAAAALIGSWLGSSAVLLINPRFLNYILIILIPIIAFFTLLNPQTGEINTSQDVPNKRKILLGLTAGLSIGFYDGFFGPGTGAFLILFYTHILKYDFVMANGNTKVANLASNLSAVIIFAISGNILYKLAIPAAVFGIFGNLLGSKLVVLRGNSIIRKIFLLVLVLLMLRLIWNLLK